MEDQPGAVPPQGKKCARAGVRVLRVRGGRAGPSWRARAQVGADLNVGPYDLFRPFSGRIIRRAEEEVATVSEGQRLAVRARCAALRAVALDHHLDAGREVRLPQTAA